MSNWVVERKDGTEWTPFFAITEALTGRRVDPTVNVRLMTELFIRAHATGIITDAWIAERLKRRFVRSPLPEAAYCDD